MLAYFCSRYDGSYSNLVVQQLGAANLDFSFTACSGAVISDVRKQANKLSSGQEFVIVSAGGNDADLAGILNSCVYSFYSDVYHPSCDKKLSASGATILSLDFEANVNNLINDVKSKLAPGGHIYYVGYGRFFDTTDTTCDAVSWHVWYSLFQREYLTQARRQTMNEVVDMMNNRLRGIIASAGPQARFIDYDSYIDMVGGRYCQPGQDESRGRSANRDQMFFYEMKTNDDPWLDLHSEYIYHDELKRRFDADDEKDLNPVNGTLGALYGAFLQAAILNSTTSIAALQDDNVDNDLEEEVREEETGSKRRRDNSTPASHFPVNGPTGSLHHVASPVEPSRLVSGKLRYGNSTGPSQGALSTSSAAAGRCVSTAAASKGLISSDPSTTLANSSVMLLSGSGKDSALPSTSSKSLASHSMRGSSAKSSKAKTGSSRGPARHTATQSSPYYPTAHLSPTGMKPLFSYKNSSSKSGTNLGTKVSQADYPGGNAYFASTAGNTTGTVVANETHILLANGKVVEKSALARKIFVSDNTARIFHPTQYGHAMIANLILYQMAADRAQSQGINDFPPAVVESTGEGWLEAVGAACSGSGTDAWAGRDPMISAVNQFCEDPHNLGGSQGALTSGTFNTDSLDYVNVSVAWDSSSNMGEHGCKAWLDAVTDGCDVPSGASNTADLKHGGLIPYRSSVVNATLNIQPLVMRRIWNHGKPTGGQRCNDIGSRNYLDQPTLESNINDYCQALTAQPHGIGYAGTNFTKIYNDGTPDRVALTTKWPKGVRNFQIFEEECQYYMATINNGCSLPEERTNAMNWKHGGSVSDNNGIEYTVAATQFRPVPPARPQSQCQTSYALTHYNIVISGSGFSNSDWGQNTLLAALKSCGVVTAWHFDYWDHPLARADGIEWFASAALPITISYGCVGRAVHQAGGPDTFC